MGKLIESYDVDEWEVLTDTGYVDIQQVHKTVKYGVWKLKTTTHTLKCADEHIVIDSDYNEVFVKDLNPGDRLITETGIEEVVYVEKLKCKPQHMYDISVKSKEHRLFTNGILSHNTTVSTVYLLHYILFNKDKTVAILANKEKTALEIMRRIRMSFESLPIWLQQGVIEGGWNKSSVQLENGVRLIAATTSTDSISGEAVSLLYMDEFAKIKEHVADDFITATLPVISSGKTSKVIMVSCVADDTFVLTPNGIKEVSDFVDYNKVEDGSVGYEVEPYRIVGHGGLKNGHIMCNSGLVNTKIITSPSSMNECSLKHQWFVCDSGKYGWKKTFDLTGDEYVAIEYGHDLWGNDDSVPNVKLNDYKGSRTNDYRIDTITEDFAYLMGLYISEGSSCKRIKPDGSIVYNGITITCGDFVAGVLERLKYKFSCSDGLHHRISSKMLCDIMISLGFDLSRTANFKIIPKRLFGMSRKNIIAMLQGIMDGDGSSQKNRGTVCIKTSSKRLMQQMRALFNNFGILSTWCEGDNGPTELCKKIDSRYYAIELNKTMSKKYYDIIGFRFERKQFNESFLPRTITRDRHDVIPYSKDLIVALKSEYPEDYRKLVDRGIMKGNYKHAPHFNRMFVLRHKQFLLSLNNPILNDLCVFVNENIKWEKITNIVDSKSKVYDFSLNETNDSMCHSVLYNNVLGHQTPVGLNHFYDFWSKARRGENDFYPIKVPWWEHPDRDEDWKNRTLRLLNGDEARFGQEYSCRFLGSTSTLIDPDILERIDYKDPVDYKWNGLLKIFEKPEDGKLYILGIDTAKGTGRDYSVVQVLKIDDEKKIKQVAVYRNNKINTHEFAQVCISISNYYNNSHMMIENNAEGGETASVMWYEYENENILNCDSTGIGIRSTKKSKLAANLLIKRYIEEGWLEILDKDTVMELSRYIEVDGMSQVFKAETRNTNDDCVTALLWAMYFIRTEFFDGKDLSVKNIDEKYTIDDNDTPFIYYDEG